MSEALERGDAQTVWAIDLERVRGKTGLDQAAFARRFGLPAPDVAAWAAAGRVPIRAIWMDLKLVERAPEAGQSRG
jgi:DNA-binding transcriptional regulator YiaG